MLRFPKGRNTTNPTGRQPTNIRSRSNIQDITITTGHQPPTRKARRLFAITHHDAMQQWQQTSHPITTQQRARITKTLSTRQDLTVRKISRRPSRRPTPPQRSTKTFTINNRRQVTSNILRQRPSHRPQRPSLRYITITNSYTTSRAPSRSTSS